MLTVVACLIIFRYACEGWAFSRGLGEALILSSPAVQQASLSLIFTHIFIFLHTGDVLLAIYTLQGIEYSILGAVILFFGRKRTATALILFRGAFTALIQNLSSGCPLCEQLPTK